VLQRLAFQTGVDKELPERLSRARGADFRGVEIIGPVAADRERRIAGQVRDAGLELLTVWTPGTPADRMAQAERMGASGLAFNQGLDELAALAACSPSVRLLIRNQIGAKGLGTGTVETDLDIGRALAELPFAGLLLDVAHLTVAEHSPKAVIAKYGARLYAIHLSDWRCLFAPGSDAFAGICRLGHGGADVEGVLAALHETAFDGWYVLTHSRPSLDPLEEALTALEYLATVAEP